MNIVNVGYDSTNFYVLADTLPKLLIDVGWPGTLPKLRHRCERTGIQLPLIPFVLCTHYHPDHAGLAQELKQVGCKLIILQSQLSAVPLLKQHMKPEHRYKDIILTDNTVLNVSDRRVFLAHLGIQGEIVNTPGHTDDSVSLVLDEGAAFTGDLTPPQVAADQDLILNSWERIRALGVKTVYPGHGPAWQLD